MQRTDLQEKLLSYIDSYRPIIYIQHFDFTHVDKIISGVIKGAKIFEYNDATGISHFQTKETYLEGNLIQFLKNINSELNKKDTFLVLKDIHKYFDNSEVLALLKALATKRVSKRNYNLTIFIISTELVIPSEIEKFITVFDVPYPTIEENKDVMNFFGKEQGIDDMEKSFTKELINDLAISLKGLTEFEVIQILYRAYREHADFSNSSKKFILEEKKQITKKQCLLEIIDSKYTIDDVGGLEKLKEWLKKKSKVIKDIEKANKFGVDTPKGLVLTGMPGCGKSLISQVAADLFELPLLKLDIGKLMGMYVGQSENNLRRATKLAEAISPCVLWIDEVEKAFSGIGNNDGNEVTKRLFGHFLTWLQEKKSLVFVIVTSNKMENLPPEFSRKGRFDESYFVDLPSEEERKSIFKIHLKKRNQIISESDINSISKGTEGFSGADIESIVAETVEKVFIDFNGEKGISLKDLNEIKRATKSFSDINQNKIKEINEKRKEMNIKSASY